MNIRHIIFDMDGVLFLSSNVHAKAYEKALSETCAAESFEYQRFAGMRTEDVFHKFLSANQIQPSPDLVRRLTERKRELASIELRRNPPVAPGCREVIGALANNYDLSLASSSSRGNVEIFLEASQTRQYFKGIFSSEDVSNAKPNPEIFLKAISLSGHGPQNTVILEDSIAGIQAARAAGAYHLFISQGREMVLNQGCLGQFSNIVEAYERFLAKLTVMSA